MRIILTNGLRIIEDKSQCLTDDYSVKVLLFGYPKYDKWKNQKVLTASINDISKSKRFEDLLL